jgi:hypothetical protein
MSEQGESAQRWNAPSAGANDYEPADRSTGPAPLHTEGDVFVAPAPRPSADSANFDGFESGPGVGNYAGVDMSGPGTPPKAGIPSSGNWQMPDWMAQDSEVGPTLDVDSREGGRSRTALFAGIGVLIIALLAAAAVFFLRSSGGKDLQPALPKSAPGPAQKKATTQAVALPAEKLLQKFPGTGSKVAGRIDDTFSGLSYPRFGQPWQVPGPKSNLLLLGWSGQQIMVTEHSGSQMWYGQLLSGVLGPAEQGIYGGPGSEMQAAVAYAQGIEARLYAFPHSSRPLASQALTLSGGKGWLISSYLTYHRTGIKATGEVVTVAVVSTGRKTPAVLVMSVPNTHKKLWPDINQVVNSLKILPK